MFYVPFSDKQEAELAAKRLMKKKLLFCANIFSASSFFLWGSKLENTKEAIAIFKTMPEKAALLEKELISIHSYEVPAILHIEAEANTAFVEAMKKELSKRQTE